VNTDDDLDIHTVSAPVIMRVRRGKNGRKPGLLSHGRPCPGKQRKHHASLSSRSARTLIRNYHILQKQHAKALADGDSALASSLEAQVTSQGGLEAYQAASINGQKADRGGDSSKTLIQWLKNGGMSRPDGKLKLLEIGALSIDNACSRSGFFEIERIDLHAQERGILEQDFMKRPLPVNEAEKFDMISLSLVLNYVPDAPSRGEMLRRTTGFLRTSTDGHIREKSECFRESFFPSLFLVLPAPCIFNSRYLDAGRLESIMSALGYRLVKEKVSNKLAYYLWVLDLSEFNKKKDSVTFRKTEVRSGKMRNNFAIILE
jgi:25S rRNA (adenine2142-N1)-methyltransferase